MNKELEIPEELFKLANDEFGMNWKSNKVVIKRFLFEDDLIIEKETVKVKANFLGNIPSVNAEFDRGAQRIATIMRAVLESPWVVNDINAIKYLPSPVVLWVEKEIEAFNTIEVKKKEILKSLSEE